MCVQNSAVLRIGKKNHFCHAVRRTYVGGDNVRQLEMHTSLIWELVTPETSFNPRILRVRLVVDTLAIWLILLSLSGFCYQCYMHVFIYKLFLSERKAGGVWKLSNKEKLFANCRALWRKVLFVKVLEGLAAVESNTRANRARTYWRKYYPYDSKPAHGVFSACCSYAYAIHFADGR
jgi:hypothetical protein